VTQYLHFPWIFPGIEANRLLMGDKTMKSMALAFLLLLLAGTAMGQLTTSDSIYEIQTGQVLENSLVTPCETVVTAVRYNGIYVAEAPYSAYNGIWVYTGSTPYHGFEVGDVVCICGEYKEYYGLSEIDIVAAGLYGSLVKTGTQAVPAPSYVAAADLLDPVVAESWESCVVTIVDGMIVTDISLGNGEWMAEALDGTPVQFDDFWYDFDSVMVNDCYNNATGIYNYSFSAFKLEPFVDGIQLTDCTVATEPVSFGAVKALYR